MSTVLTGGLPSQINRDARHLLLVEGEEDRSFDPSVLRSLLDRNDLTAVNVAALGSCENIHQAAKAMFYQHRDYYFVIDRDGRNDAFVEKSWSNFPDPDSYNLLVWRRHELENYFIDPDYLAQSEFLIKSKDELCQLILQHSQKRLFLDAVNLVLLGIRERLIQPPKAFFRNPDDFKDRASALTQLKTCVGLDDKQMEVQSLLEQGHRETQLDYWIDRLGGGRQVLEFGLGDWISLLSGKEIFNSIVAQAFTVVDTENQHLQGKAKCTAIARKLLSLSLDSQPTDFRQLVNIIKQRLTSR